MSISPSSRLRQITDINSAGSIFPGKPVIDALAENVTDTSRGTTLVQNNASVSTIEHVLAALHGLQVDNALIELNGPEAPIMGGCFMGIRERNKGSRNSRTEGGTKLFYSKAENRFFG